MAYFTYVDREALLRGLVLQWSKEQELAIDLEMEANLHHYGLHLAMIQVSDGKDTWLVDPLAIDDLGPVVELFENPAVQKVFHDVSFDFRILEELLGCRPKNVFDTKIAALLLGKESISLGGLLQEYFQVEKQEKFQRIDWLQRPLDPDMLAYAAGDVKYLLQLKRRLEAELKGGGRWPWFEEENAYRTTQSYRVKEKTCQDIKGAKSITDKERGVLNEFFILREQYAKRLDKPVFFVMPDKVMLELAQRPPRLEEWGTIKRVHPAVKRSAYKWVKAARQAKPIPKERGSRTRLTPRQGQLV